MAHTNTEKPEGTIANLQFRLPGSPAVTETDIWEHAAKSPRASLDSRAAETRHPNPVNIDIRSPLPVRQAAAATRDP